MKAKHNLSCLLILLMVFLLTGCGESGSAGNSKSISSKIKVEDYVQNAIDYANMIGGSGLIMDEQGNFYVKDDYTSDKDRLAKLYSCYGKDIKQIRDWAAGAPENLLILTRDGDVYRNAELILKGKNVKDMLWTTNNVNVDAELLLENGDFTGCNDSYVDEEHQRKEGETIVACRWRHNTISLDKKGNVDLSSTYWDNCEIKDWKNIVVMACTVNEDEETATIAGIAGDGTVYATGDYADEILSWGELAYITMDDQLIVGMKKDGTLKFAGEKANVYASVDIGPVKGVRAWRGYLCGITANGVFSSYYEYADTAEVSVTNAETGDGPFKMKMDKEGVIYKNTGDGWEVTDYPKADADNAFNLILYQELMNGKTDTTDIVSFMLCDLNNDGKQEVIVEDNLAGNVGRMKVCKYNGYLEEIVTGTYITGYYPEAGIVVSSVVKARGNSVSTYRDINSGDRIGAIYFTADAEYHYSIENGQETAITEEEFETMLTKYTKNEEMCKIDSSKLIENTPENCEKVFLK